VQHSSDGPAVGHGLYLRYGQRIAAMVKRSVVLRAALKPVFDAALVRAIAWYLSFAPPRVSKPGELNLDANLPMDPGMNGLSAEWTHKRSALVRCRVKVVTVMSQM
jgi:hypothetical protein